MAVVKKERKVLQISFVKVYIHASFNNTIVTITDKGGNVVAWSSGGCHKFKGSRKSTPHVAGVITKSAIEKFYTFVKNEASEKIFAAVFIRGPGSGAESCVRVVSSFFVVKSISNITGIPHNGCRPKKMRRI